jgi:5-methylcytosine-specific restriction endonuclease McrA
LPYKDPERRRQYGREWIKKNAEKAREAMRRWRSRHPDAHNAEHRLYYSRHTERLKAKKKAYDAANPQVRRVARQLRRARQANADGSYTTKEWLELLEVYAYRCAYCDADGPLHADHAIPLFRGGTAFIWNIRPACPPCNLHKHKLTEDEYRERRRKEGLYVRPRVRLPLRWLAAMRDSLKESSGSFSASLMSRDA